MEKPAPSASNLEMECGNGNKYNTSSGLSTRNVPPRITPFASSSCRSLRGVSTGKGWSEQTQKPGSSNSSAQETRSRRRSRLCPLYMGQGWLLVPDRRAKKNPATAAAQQ